MLFSKENSFKRYVTLPRGVSDYPSGSLPGVHGPMGHIMSIFAIGGSAVEKGWEWLDYPFCIT